MSLVSPALAHGFFTTSMTWEAHPPPWLISIHFCQFESTLFFKLQAQILRTCPYCFSSRLSRFEPLLKAFPLSISLSMAVDRFAWQLMRPVQYLDIFLFLFQGHQGRASQHLKLGKIFCKITHQKLMEPGIWEGGFTETSLYFPNKGILSSPPWMGRSWEQWGKFWVYGTLIPLCWRLPLLILWAQAPGIQMLQ